MDQLTLCWVLLLPPGLCRASGVTMTTMGGEPDATPICSNTTEHTVTLVVCKILTEGSGEECLLLFRYGGGGTNGHPCDSRFTLVTENQTVFLHLAGLTPVDSGNYTCQCSHEDGMEVLHLRITVQGKEEEEDIFYLKLLIVAVISVSTTVTAGVIFGFICKRKRCGDGLRAATSGPSGCETPDSLDADDPDDPDDPYTSLQQPAGDLYQTVAHFTSHMTNICFDNQEMDGEADQRGQDIYDNIKL